MKKRILTLFLTLVLCVGLAVPALADKEFDLQGEHVSGAYTYTVQSDGTAMIVAYNKDLSVSGVETLSIPSELDGYKVTSLGSMSFSYTTPYGIKAIIVPEGVVYINDGAFSYTNKTTTTLSLPSTLKYIGANAFNGWEALQTLVIPENVTSIGQNAFFTFEPDENKGLKTVICYSKDADLGGKSLYENSAFDGCKNCTFYGYPGSTLETLVTGKLASKEVSTQQADGSWKSEWVSTGNTFRDIAGAPVPVTPVQPDPSAGFADVPTGAYYAAPVAWAVEKGITNGTSATTFSPDATCSRGQIITFLWRAAGSPEPKSATPFSDVKADAYYAKATAWAAEQGIEKGSAFSPNASCTRLMAAEFIWKQAGSPDAAAANFIDVSSDAVNWALQEGVTSGTSATTFSPDTACSRGQIVTFLYRAFAE